MLPTDKVIFYITTIKSCEQKLDVILNKKKDNMYNKEDFEINESSLLGLFHNWLTCKYGGLQRFPRL